MQMIRIQQYLQGISTSSLKTHAELENILERMRINKMSANPKKTIGHPSRINNITDIAKFNNEWDQNQESKQYEISWFSYR